MALTASDESLHDVAKTILDKLRACLGPLCKGNAFVSLGRPPGDTDLMAVWRSNGPTPITTNRAAPVFEVEYTVAISTCCAPVVGYDAARQAAIVPGTADLGKAAHAHNRLVGTLFGALAANAETWLGQRARVTGTRPEEGATPGCFTDMVTVTVPWFPAPCGTC